MNKQRTTITLHELEVLWQKHMEKESGKLQVLAFPMELTPAYFKWCKSNPTAWQSQKQKRQDQLVMMEMHMTHQIDYYLTQEPIVPY
jgi:hypothetical protein